MNSMQMPQQAQPMQGAGLGAMIRAKGGSGAGATKQSMNELMALAQKMPDSELADVLAGKNRSVPQFAAMLAAMGRESLRTAVAGAQAGQAKEPSAKDRMLAKMSPQTQQAPAGLGVLPAPNMEQMGEGMADGGIVGYADRGLVQPDDDGITPDVMERLKKDDPNAFQRIMRRIMPGVSDDASGDTRSSTVFTPSVSEIPFTNAETEGGAALPYRRQRGASNAPTPAPRSDTLLPKQDLQLLNPNYTPPAEIEEPGGLAAKVGLPTSAKIDKNKPGTTQAGQASAGSRVPGIAPPSSPATAQRKSFLDELESGKDENTKRISEGKSQAQGEFLMQLGAQLMSTPNLGQALSKGVQAGLPGLAASRKEINSLVKDQREYNLNMAKAKEAAAQGNEELAFKYAKLAEDSKYQAGMVAAANMRGGANDSRITTAAMNKAQDQLKLAMGDPRQRRALGTVEAQQAFLDNAFRSNLSILSGQGPVTPSIPTYGEIPQGAVIRD